MQKIKKYDEWLNESSEEKMESSLFIKMVQKALDENGFSYELDSSPVQIKHGTVVLKGVNNSAYVIEKLKELNAHEMVRSDMSGQDWARIYSQRLGSPRKLIIYSKGSIRYEGASSDTKKFSPTAEKINSVVIPWLKKQLIDRATDALAKFVKISKTSVHRSLMGYPLTSKNVNLITKTLGEDLKFQGGETWSSFIDANLEDKLTDFGSGIANVFSPFLVAAYLMKNAGMKVKVQFNLFDSPSLNFSWREDAQNEDNLQIKTNLVKKFTKEDTELEYLMKIEMTGANNTYEKLVADTSGIAKAFLQIAKDSKNAADLENIAQEKRGKITASRFGF